MIDARHKNIVAAIMGLPDHETDAYYLALGKFLSQYANVEEALRACLWQLAGLKFPVAQAVLGAVRADQAMGDITRVIDALGWPSEKKSDVETVFAQLRIINKLRNDIVHRGARLQADGNWLTSNAAIIHTPKKLVETVFSASKLDAARSDLFSIRAALISLTWGEKAAEGLEDWAKPALAGAWQYMPLGSERKTGKSQQARRKPPRPPKSSLQ